MLGPLEKEEFRLHVPVALILKINGRQPDEASRLRAGETLKMIYGPFHAVVDKSDFTMDIFLHRPGLERIFIARMPVGLGKHNTTPAGLWRIKLGGKMEKQDWYPPPSSDINGRIPYGHPDYAFGEKGLWMSLEGFDEDTEGLTGYGIHSTNKPESIGTMSSLGCSRLADEDIEFLYTVLYEHWSTVLVKP